MEIQDLIRCTISGNLSAAVGPYAIDEGLIDATAPVTRVRIHQVNTGKVIVAEVLVRGNRAEVEGNHVIDGVPGTGAKLVLDWADSAGALTGKLLPTGNVVDILPVEGLGDVEVSLVDAAIPVVFIDAVMLGLKGNETPQEIDSNEDLLKKIEKIRGVAAVRMGLCNDWKKATQKVPYSPFFAICTSPVTYKSWTTGEIIPEESVDLVVRQSECLCRKQKEQVNQSDTLLAAYMAYHLRDGFLIIMPQCN